MVVKLSDLERGERFEARDPMRPLQYAGCRGHAENDDSYVTITYQVGGLGGTAAYRLEEIQEDCNQRGFIVTRA